MPFVIFECQKLLHTTRNPAFFPRFSGGSGCAPQALQTKGAPASICSLFVFGDFGDVRRCKPFSWESAPVRLIPELASDYGDALNLSLDIFPKQRLDADQRDRLRDGLAVLAEVTRLPHEEEA